MTRYLDGSRAIWENSPTSSLNLGLLDGSIIQPAGRRGQHTTMRKQPSQPAAPPAGSALTLQNYHVDFDGADGRLRQPLPVLQHRGDLLGRDAVVRFGSERHQLPNCHTCRDRSDFSLVSLAITPHKRKKNNFLIFCRNTLSHL